MRRAGLRQLALRRELLVTLAGLQRAQLRHDLRMGPWRNAFGAIRTSLRWFRAVRAALQRSAP
jgi:hypothetical protein